MTHTSHSVLSLDRSFVRCNHTNTNTNLDSVLRTILYCLQYIDPFHLGLDIYIYIYKSSSRIDWLIDSESHYFIVNEYSAWASCLYRASDVAGKKWWSWHPHKVSNFLLVLLIFFFFLLVLCVSSVDIVLLLIHELPPPFFSCSFPWLPLTLVPSLPSRHLPSFVLPAIINIGVVSWKLTCHPDNCSFFEQGWFGAFAWMERWCLSYVHN